MQSKPADTLPGLGFASPGDALAWLVAMGADEIVLEQPVNRFLDQTPALKAPAPAAPALALQAERSPLAPPPLPDMAGLNSLAAITQALNFLDAHPLRKSAMKLSFFEGPERADVLVIGDHPRKEEDRSGQVFAGKARLLLANMLAAINLKLEDVGLMNVMPWRPLGGAVPRPEHMAPVLPLIRRAVDLVAPKLILSFSALPGVYLAGGDASIQRQRGGWLEVGTTPLLATFHPDELLRMPNLKRQAWRDLQAFQEKLK